MKLELYEIPPLEWGKPILKEHNHFYHYEKLSRCNPIIEYDKGMAYFIDFESGDVVRFGSVEDAKTEIEQRHRKAVLANLKRVRVSEVERFRGRVGFSGTGIIIPEAHKGGEYVRYQPGLVVIEEGGEDE